MSTPAQETTTIAISDNTRSLEDYERLTNLHDSYKPFWLTETIQLGPLLPSDKDALLEYLNDVRIHQWLHGPPNPYKPEDADFWINSRLDRMTANGTPLSLCFRDMARGGKAVGSVVVSNEDDSRLDGDDAGYWLAPEYQGQGLMARALITMLRKVSIDEVGKRKFNAHAFEGNWASRRTLEKAGFVYQPGLKKVVVKDGKDINLWVFRMILTDEDIAKQGIITEATPAPSLAL